MTPQRWSAVLGAVLMLCFTAAVSAGAAAGRQSSQVAASGHGRALSPTPLPRNRSASRSVAPPAVRMPASSGVRRSLSLSVPGPAALNATVKTALTRHTSSTARLGGPATYDARVLVRR
jgi:hypothetical protein